jgi:hypothetical protein
MANLVKISDVRLYVGFTPNAANTYAALQAVTAANVPFVLMSYADSAAHKGVFDALSTWSYGRDASKVEVTDFPFLTWTENYDDWSSCPQIAVGHEAVANSTPLLNKSLVG